MQTYTFNSPSDKVPLECSETIHIARGDYGWCIRVGVYEDSPSVIFDRLNPPKIEEIDGWHFVDEVNFINEKIRDKYVYVISRSTSGNNNTVILLAFFTKLLYASRNTVILEQDNDSEAGSALMAIPLSGRVKFKIGKQNYFFENISGKLLGPKLSE